MIDGRAQLSTGISVAYTSVGPEGAPVAVLLHPWLESRQSFGPMLPSLSTRLRVLALDQRGAGESDKPATGYDVKSLAADVTAFMDEVGVDSALLVGASSGGYVAQEVAASAPRRVTGLVLAGAPRSLEGRRPPFADEVEALRDPIDPEWAARFTASFTHGSVSDEFLAARTRDALTVPAAIWRASLAGLLSSPTPAADRIVAPTLIVSGAHDSVLGIDDARGLAATIPRATWIEYEDTGHVVIWEQPERLSADILEFAQHACPPTQV
ncbi:alpha/beta hydrolase [Tessaracoccus sp. MC1627]|uniref:alpha/beta fold hydrolase n=1 Tax=Tessaracoccus sp. MC1627 TaxID=2760312 RepID=UPI001603F58B|nr:alpha/beta hydrolase [Tessaracoccus sp. MC1627]